jgi:propanediol dehydratase small subunit
MTHKLNPPTKLYTQRELFTVLRLEIVKALMPYKPSHEELKKVIKELKKKYGNSR